MENISDGESSFFFSFYIPVYQIKNNYSSSQPKLLIKNTEALNSSPREKNLEDTR
jgi:hypothetical protein